jgi:uncharacterized membrane protein YjjP (DUF1212 family)
MRRGVVGALLLGAVVAAGLVGCPASPPAAAATLPTTAPPETTAGVVTPAPTTLVPSEQSTPPPAATTTAAPSESASTSPTPTTSAEPTPTTRTPSPEPTASQPSPEVTLPATKPAVQDSGVSAVNGLLAVVALVVAGLALWAVHRSERGPTGTATTAGLRLPATDTAATATMVVKLGDAMVDSGYTVTQVQDTLSQVLRVNQVTGGEVIVLPTALFVSVPGQARVETAVAAASVSRLRLDQVDAVSRVVTAAETGAASPGDVLTSLREIRHRPAPYGPVARTVGYALLSSGVALVLGGTGPGVLVAAALGVLVGSIHLLSLPAGATTRAVVPLFCAALVAATVFLLGRLDLEVGVLAPLVAPLVTFLPGVLLTTAVIELSTGQMVSGAGRLVSGLLQLALLALGVVAGAQLVGIPATSLNPDVVRPLGEGAPWLGVALFGVGVVVHHCAPRSSVWWILLVLYVAYGAQIIGGLFLGAVLSAFVGSLVMSPVAVYVASRPTGPPPQVTFQPAFWLLVPGALGLVGVTQLLGPNRVDAVGSLVTMGSTMIGISLGVLVGLAFGAGSLRFLSTDQGGAS